MQTALLETCFHVLLDSENCALPRQVGTLDAKESMLVTDIYNQWFCRPYWAVLVYRTLDKSPKDPQS